MRLKMQMRVVSACVGLLSLGSSWVQVPAQEPVRAPDATMSVFIPGVEVLAVPGMPFSAMSTIEWIRTLPDGSTVTRRLNSAMARDSSGRVYRERHHFAPDETRPAPLYETIVMDPTNGAETTCTMATHRCVLKDFRARTKFHLAPAGPFANGKGSLTRDALGTNTMQGLQVEGTREITTVYAGVAGNSNALVTTREFWYSPDLQTNLAVTRNDPATGQQVIRLSSVSRSEPEAAQFAVPAGFTVEDARRHQP